MAARGQRTTEHDGDGGEVQQQTRPPETVLILSLFAGINGGSRQEQQLRDVPGDVSRWCPAEGTDSEGGQDSRDG